jgi:hypothetical protein
MVAGGSISATVKAVNLAIVGSISLSSTPTTAEGDIDIFNVNNVGTGTPQILVVQIVATVP